MYRQTVESEWVDTGAEFALRHPLSQRLSAIWLIVGWVSTHALLAVWVIADLLSYGGYGLALALFLILLVLNDIVAILTLIGRDPRASRSVWICLIVTFPLSIPLVVYWADGPRPNLIYRHRFERLVPTPPARLGT